jgi:AcrR family transcriptional regulator
MAEVKRSYDASGRREAARARRTAVVRTAATLFARDGFQATTMAAIARAAGVSPETVYKGFGTKAALAKAVFDQVLAGDDEPVAIADRPDAQAVRREPDARRKIALYVDGLVRRQQRSAAVQLIIRDGRHADDTLAEVWAQLQQEALTGMTALGRHLLDTGQLRDGITLAEVRDVLWAYVSIELYDLLVLQRGWPVERYATWAARSLTDALCGPAD